MFSDTATPGQLAVVQAAAKRLGTAPQVVKFTRVPYDYEGAFAQARRTKAEAVLVLASGFFVPARRQIPELALKHHLPSIFGKMLIGLAHTQP